MKKFSIITITIILWSFLFANEKPELLIFYKEKEPSQRVLEKVDSVLNNFRDSYQIKYFNVMDEKNKTIANELGLPQPHLPFAVVINGKFTAKIDTSFISFVHFPLFMHGIGRHEGNWSIDYLRMVLEDNSLLHNKNILPESEHIEEDERPE